MPLPDSAEASPVAGRRAVRSRRGWGMPRGPERNAAQQQVELSRFLMRQRVMARIILRYPVHLLEYAKREEAELLRRRVEMRSRDRVVASEAQRYIARRGGSRANRTATPGPSLIGELARLARDVRRDPSQRRRGAETLIHFVAYSILEQIAHRLNEDPATKGEVPVRVMRRLLRLNAASRAWLLKDSLPLVRSIVARYAACRPAIADDLFQEGVIALDLALSKYIDDRGLGGGPTRLSTLATRWILAGVRACLRKEEGAVHLNVRQRSRLFQVRSALEALVAASPGRSRESVSDAEVVEATGLRLQEVRELRVHMETQVLSLDEAAPSGSVARSEQVAAPGSGVRDRDAASAREERVAAVRAALATLRTEVRAYAFFRFGVGEDTAVEVLRELARRRVAELMSRARKQ